MQWFNRIIAFVLPIFPKSFVWIFSKKYIAGKSLDEAIKVTKDLNKLGCCATIDVLGEEIENLKEAELSRDESIQVLEAIDKHKLDANLSIKPTSLGLRIDKEACYKNIEAIIEKAKKLNNFVRIDMEDATTTDDTMEIYKRLRKKYSNVGAVIQSYLMRSEKDVQDLIDNKIAHLRLCKGIYIESAKIAYKNKQKVRDNFMDMAFMMLKSKSYIGLATHDKQLVERSLEVIHETKANPSDYEFQMLLGVTEKMRAELISKGYKLRVYVPYGEMWYGYSMRRLNENPNMIGHIIKNLFIRG